MTSSPVLTNAIGAEVLQALGLQGQHITEVKLKLKAGSLVELDVSQMVSAFATVETARFLDSPAVLNTINIVRRFHLHEQPPPHESNRTPRILEVLLEAESFVRGFEDDEMQEGIPELLQKLRDCIGLFTLPKT